MSRAGYGIAKYPMTGRRPTKAQLAADAQRPAAVRSDEQGVYVYDYNGQRHDFGSDASAALDYAKTLWRAHKDQPA